MLPKDFYVYEKDFDRFITNCSDESLAVLKLHGAEICFQQEHSGRNSGIHYFIRMPNKGVRCVIEPKHTLFLFPNGDSVDISATHVS